MCPSSIFYFATLRACLFHTPALENANFAGFGEPLRILKYNACLSTSNDAKLWIYNKTFRDNVGPYIYKKFSAALKIFPYFCSEHAYYQ